jgi:hypothetical protein
VPDLTLISGKAQHGVIDMDNPADTLDADEAILTYTVSDEAIEAAAGIERMSDTIRAPMCRDTLLVVTCPSR